MSLSPERVAVSAAFFANGFLVGSWAPQIPVFAGRLALSESELGLMILAFGIGAVAAMPVVGRLIGLWGSRRPILGLHLALVAALPLVVLLPGVPLAVLAILFTGVATGGMDVAMNANAVSVERRLGKAIMSSCHGFWSLGGLVGSGLGGVAIAGLGAGPHALLSAGVIFACWFVVRRGALGDAAPAVPRQEGSGHRARDMSEESAERRVGYAKAVAIGVFALFTMIPEGAAIDWSAVYLRQDLGAGAAASGLAFAAFSMTMAILRFFGDGIRNRLGAVTTARTSSLAAIAGLVLIAFGEDVPITLAGFALMGIGISNIVPIAFSAAGNLPGLRPGTAISIVTTLGYSGILVAPSAIGFAAERVGFPAVFLALAGLVVVTLLVAPLVAGADRPRTPPAA